MPPPNLNTLRAFEASARHLTFRRAAQDLSVTTGAISQQIKQLEVDLDVSLFTRHRRGLALTDAGHRLYKGLEPALKQISVTIAELKSFSDRISLEIPPSLAARWLAPRLPRFVAEQSDIDLVIQAGKDRPKDRPDADFILHAGEPWPLDGYRAERLSSLRLVAVTGPNLIARPPVIARAAFFAQYPLIEDETRRWRAWFALNGPETAYESLGADHTAQALDRAEAGEGIALVPELLAREALASGRLVLLKDMGEAPGGVFLHRASNAPQSKARETVANWIRAEI